MIFSHDEKKEKANIKCSDQVYRESLQEFGIKSKGVRKALTVIFTAWVMFNGAYYNIDNIVAVKGNHSKTYFYTNMARSGHDIILIKQPVKKVMKKIQKAQRGTRDSIIK